MRDSHEFQKASEKSLTTSKEQARVAEVMNEWSNRLDTNASNWVYSELKRRALDHQYNRASPDEQQAMVLDLVKEYARPGGMEINGQWVPAWGPEPQPFPAKNLQAEYAATSIGGSAEVMAANAANRSTVSGMQADKGVLPSTPVHDDVGKQAKAGIDQVRDALAAGKEKVSTNYNQRVEEYNKGTSFDRFSKGHWNLSRDASVTDQFTMVYDQENRPQKKNGPTVPDKPVYPELQPGLVDQIPKP